MTMTIVSGAGDETLQFRNIFPSMKTPAYLMKILHIWAEKWRRDRISLQLGTLTFLATSIEVDRAHSCCEGHSLVTSPEQPPRIWRWDCQSVYPLLEYYKWELNHFDIGSQAPVKDAGVWSLGRRHIG
ncbi:hypothetical protein AAG906_003305 [Vitis piasezkii]